MTDPDLPDDRLRKVVSAMADLVRARHQDRVIVEQEKALAETPAFSWPPAPMTVHPAYERHAAMVRDLMARGAYEINTVKPRPPKFVLDTDPVPPPTAWNDDIVRLTVRKAWAPAPYVGEPYAIVWPVALDSYNRFVAGEPHLQFVRPSTLSDPNVQRSDQL